jgi:hypothetical protein
MRASIAILAMGARITGARLQAFVGRPGPTPYFVTCCVGGLAAVMMLASIPLPARAQDAEKRAGMEESLPIRLVNKTGKFTDAECFWSLDDGKEWRSFAEQSTILRGRSSGKMYFRLGSPPKNFEDRETHWDFIKYATWDARSWEGSTSQIDAFCIPLTIQMGTKKIGIEESRSVLFEKFRQQAPAAFKGCVIEDKWIVAPSFAGFQVGEPHEKYFEPYIDEVWAMYATEKKTPSGKWTGKVVDGALIFTPVSGIGEPLVCPSKPTTQDVLLGKNTMATNRAFCAAINRHVLADPADWENAATYYKAEPCNWYAKFFHEHSVGRKAFGFRHDDVAQQAAYFSNKGSEVVITLYWEGAPK